VLRSLEDRLLRSEAVLKGRSLDLGSGGSSYLARLQHAGHIVPITVDIRLEARPDIVANLERGLPFRDGSMETVLLHNVLEHVAGCDQLVVEIARVLAPGGTLYMSMPFLMPVHERLGSKPYRDYRRLSGAGLHVLLADFSVVQVHALEVGPFLAAFHVGFSAVPLRAVRAAMACLAWAADSLYARVRRRRDPETHMVFALGYVAVAER
jgi:SAM-dependent methyltransferase